MDDVLEEPSAATLFIASVDANEYGSGQQASEDEEDGPPDWTRFSAIAQALSASKSAPCITRPVIPKRGEKEFEPLMSASDNVGSGASAGAGILPSTSGLSLQQHKLERIRAAMLSALDVERRINSKTLMHAEWRPSAGRARVLVVRGNQLISMGHSAPRYTDDGEADTPMSGLNKGKRIERVTELLPEEALYLVERGSMFCWTQLDDVGNGNEIIDGYSLKGTPMTVQQAYTVMIGREDLTLERYQVYAYLRRLGYVIIRAHPPSRYYPTPSSYLKPSPTKATPSVLSRLVRFLSAPFRWLVGTYTATIDWWRPLRTGFLHRFLSYSSIFRALRIIPSGHDLPFHHFDSSRATAHPEQKESPYRIFFNAYKPSTPFRKTAPPPPDFHIVVVDARTTSMPTLQELSYLFERIPPSPPPLPRRRGVLQIPSKNRIKSDSTTKSHLTEGRAHISSSLLPASVSSTSTSIPPASPRGNWRFSLPLFPVFRRWRHRDSQDVEQAELGAVTKKGEGEKEEAPRRHVHPFAALKAGRRSVVVAVVDSGTISFFRFAEGAFDEWPMV